MSKLYLTNKKISTSQIKNLINELKSNKDSKTTINDTLKFEKKTKIINVKYQIRPLNKNEIAIQLEFNGKLDASYRISFFIHDKPQIRLSAKFFSNTTYNKIIKINNEEVDDICYESDDNTLFCDNIDFFNYYMSELYDKKDYMDSKHINYFQHNPYTEKKHSKGIYFMQGNSVIHMYKDYNRKRKRYDTEVRAIRQITDHKSLKHIIVILKMIINTINDVLKNH